VGSSTTNKYKSVTSTNIAGNIHAKPIPSDVRPKLPTKLTKMGPLGKHTTATTTTGDLYAKHTPNDVRTKYPTEPLTMVINNQPRQGEPTTNRQQDNKDTKTRNT